MNVVVEALPNCLASIRVEVGPEVVSKTREQIVAKITKEAKIPGFRSGKVPRSMVEKRFQKDIAEELESVMLSQALDDAVREKGLKIIEVKNVDEVQFGEDKAFSFSATLVTVPEFELPEYKGVAIEVPSDEVKAEDVDAALENLRERRADFVDVAEDRGAAMDDFVVVDYKGTIGGSPLHEAFPKLGKILGENEGFWIRMTEEAFFPGFCQNLVGAKKGENRKFQIEVPADFPIEGLPGQKVDYDVTLKEIKKRELPELNDEFAASFLEGKTLADLRELVQKDLDTRKKSEVESVKRDRVMSVLLEKVECELPEDLARAESNRVLREMVKANQERGISEDILKENEKELVSTASQTGRNRVKGSFILTKIAESEKIEVTNNEMMSWISVAARENDMTVDRVVKEMRKRRAFAQVRSDILTSKALDFVVSNATVTVEGAA
jgi:trigger factor